MDLPMNNAEIVASYKNAAYPDKQIAVLADLNVCKKSDIKRILQDAGALVTDGAKETAVLADEPTGFEKVERECDAEHDLKAAKKTVEDQQRQLMAAHNRNRQLEEKLRKAEADCLRNMDLLRTVELTFDLLEKIWERI